SGCRAWASPVTARSRCPCKTVVDSSRTGHAPLAADDNRCDPVYASRGRCSEKIGAGAIPRGGCRRGKEGEGERQQAATTPNLEARRTKGGRRQSEPGVFGPDVR